MSAAGRPRGIDDSPAAVVGRVTDVGAGTVSAARVVVFSTEYASFRWDACRAHHGSKEAVTTGRGAGREVVAGRRCGQVRTPPELVRRRVHRRQVGLQVAQRERGDGVTRRVEGRAALEVEGRSHQREVPAADGEVAPQGGRRPEQAGGRGRLHGVERVGGVDGPVGALDGLGRVEELRARPRVDAVALDVGRPEGREHLAARAHRLDVAVGRVEQVPVRLLRDESVVDEGEAPGDRPVRLVEDHARLGVLHQAHHDLEPGSGAHREDAGGIAVVRVHRPQERARRGELVDQHAVVGGQVDVPRGVDHRGGRIALGEQCG